MMRLLLILVFSASSFGAVVGQDTTFHVMSYNIRLPVPQDGLNYWSNRRQLVYSIFNFYEPDIIGVQEAFRRQLNDIVTEFPDYGWYGVCRTDGMTDPKPDGEFTAILYRKSRFRLLDGGTFWLSEHPDSVGLKGWDAQLPRTVTWAQFRDNNTGKEFFHFNTHFDHIGVAARTESAKLILQKIQAIAGNAPTILTGDFNCSVHEAPYKTITDDANPRHLSDGIEVSHIRHHGPRGSFTGTFSAGDLTEERIDYIFVSQDLDVHKHAILSDNWYGQTASDHLPVFAKIAIR
jgi:endonuclease/exonuclease/phosphatase family metal-dependent hydrolase